MNKKINVFIPSAGLGERLRPITNHIPKPLLPILGKPVLQSVIEKVLTLPVKEIGINLHHKKEVIKSWIKQSLFKKNIKLFPEKQLLGTGGALKNVENFLGKNTFLVHNSDIVSKIDLGALIKSHCSSKNLVTLAVHDFPEFNCLTIDGNGFLREIGTATRRKPGPRKLLAFTGIAVYEPEFLKFLPAGASSVVDAWKKAITAGYSIGTMDVSGSYWSDIGTPSAYASTVFDALRADGETVYIHPSAKNCKDIDLQGNVVIEKGCKLDKNVSLRNCIVLPGCSLRKEESKNPPSPPFVKRGTGGFYENCIIGPDYKIGFRKSEVFGLSGDNDALLIGTGGSDRKYYREKKNRKSVVSMHCVKEDKDYQRQIEYTRFFLKYNIPVPELIKVAPDKKTAVFEDLGDISLYSWLKCPRKQKQIENIYKQVIDILILIHAEASKHVSECPALQNRFFDYEHFRWETNYFIERFVRGIKNVQVKNLSALNKEFHSLAIKADSFPKTVIHRDFQSQNIMVTKGDVLRIIDYQGARMGPPAYDVASILWDPYFRLRDGMRERLLDYYVREMTNKSNNKFQEKDFRQTLISCRLQRHMQALGAYGFLSAVKDKQYFLKHVPEGLRLLKEDMLPAKKEYPVLYELVMKIGGGV
jgi:NDP-sugar pyrophosphorylase family protein/thiamine kinase-like enzyme